LLVKKEERAAVAAAVLARQRGRTRSLRTHVTEETPGGAQAAAPLRPSFTQHTQHMARQWQTLHDAVCTAFTPRTVAAAAPPHTAAPAAARGHTHFSGGVRLRDARALLLLVLSLVVPFRHGASATQTDAFWAAALKLPQLPMLPDDSSLPELVTQPPGVRRVAVCVTGGARSFPLAALGIYNSIKANLVDALDANVTDFFYVLELTSDTDHGGKGGRFNYSVADLAAAFAVLPPKAALLSPRFSAACGWVCYTQFDKLASCLALIQKTEREERTRYDFVVRQRPDMKVYGRFPPVWRLKRAVYAGFVKHGLVDMTYFTHRDFADGALGMVSPDEYWCAASAEAGNPRSCVVDPRLRRFMNDTGCGTNACECWFRASVRLQRGVVVTTVVHEGVIRLPAA
jgi:hypothetical protein